MNELVVENKSYDKYEASILAPGATKNNTKIKIDKKEKKILIIVDGKKVIEDYDLSFKKELIIESMYDLDKINASISNGIIKIVISIDSERIKEVEVK